MTMISVLDRRYKAKHQIRKHDLCAKSYAIKNKCRPWFSYWAMKPNKHAALLYKRDISTEPSKQRTFLKITKQKLSSKSNIKMGHVQLDMVFLLLVSTLHNLAICIC